MDIDDPGECPSWDDPGGVPAGTVLDGPEWSFGPIGGPGYRRSWVSMILEGSPDRTSRIPYAGT